MSKDSWVNSIDKIDCNTSTDNGCHIHVSRTAFIDDKHYALTYHLLHSMAKGGILEEIGGREFTDYCNLDTVPPKIHKHTKTKKEEGSRSMWCNETVENTVEFRFFLTTNDPKQLKRYIQLLDSTIKYTRYHKKTVSFKGLVKYIKKYTSKYKELSKFLEGKTDVEIQSVIFKLPKTKKYLPHTIPHLSIGNIVGIKHIGATERAVSSDSVVVYKNKVTFRDSTDMYSPQVIVPYGEIEYLLVEANNG